MAYWSYIHGTVTVRPMGRTNEESEYILKTILNHLPRVTGGDEDMNVYTIRKNGFSDCCSCDEFGDRTNNLIDCHGKKSRKYGWLRTQLEYILVVDAALEYEEFEGAYRQFVKWLVRLGKRVQIKNILVEIKGYEKSSVIKSRNIQNEKHSWQSVFDALYECPTWCNDSKDEYKEPNWCEFLMWERAKDLRYPMMLKYKYFRDAENDEEVQRRIRYQDEE